MATCQSICLMGMQGMFSTQVYIRGPYNLRDLHASRRGATFVLTPERPNFQLSDASRCPRPFIHIQKVHFTAFGCITMTCHIGLGLKATKLHCTDVLLDVTAHGGRICGLYSSLRWLCLSNLIPSSLPYILPLLNSKLRLCVTDFPESHTVCECQYRNANGMYSQTKHKYNPG